MKPRILHVIDHTGDGGAQVVVQYLADSLRDRFHVDVAVLGKAGQFSDTYQSLGISVFELGGKDSRWNPMSINSLIRLIRHEKHNLIHTHLFKSNILGTIAAHRTGCRTILHDHIGVYPQSMTHYMPNGAIRGIYFAAYRYALHHSDRVILLTPETLQAYLKCYSVDSRKCVVVPNAVDIDQFYASNNTRRSSSIRTALGILGDARLIMMIGRLDPEKGWRTFLNVARRVRQASTGPCVFLAVGSGAEAQALQDYARDQGLDHVFFLGYRNDIPLLLAQADVFLLTSRREPFGIVVLEAMAAGCPVVATRSGGPDAIVTDEVDGLLAEVGDVEGLSRHVIRLLSDNTLGQRLAQQARKKVVEHYSLTGVGAQMARIYTQVLEG